MRRFAANLGALACALVLPAAAHAQLPSSTRPVVAQATTTQATGVITGLTGSWFTIQTSGRRTGVVNALVSAANATTVDDYPYVWGGGHPEAGVASAAISTHGKAKGPVGFDCSGSVAAVLAGAGLWPAGGPVPSDAGVISELLAQKLIARGPGTGSVQVTLYDHPGVHIFMNIDGRFFGTSDGGGGGSTEGGPGWLYDGAPDAASHAFKQYHVLPSVLKDSTSYGHTLTFQTDTDPTLLAGAVLGNEVTVSYAPGANATMVANALTYVGAIAADGTVTAVAADDSSFTIAESDGTNLLLTPSTAGVLDGLAIGDAVTVSYNISASTLVAHVVTVTTPAASPAPPTTSPSATTGPAVATVPSITAVPPSTPAAGSTATGPGSGGGSSDGSSGAWGGYGGGYGGGGDYGGGGYEAGS